MKIKAVILDCDGTMFDTELLSMQSFQIIADQIHFKLPDDFFANIIGTTRAHIIEYLQDFPDYLAVFDQIYVKWQELISNACGYQDSLNKPGLTALLDYLFANNYKVAIASSSHREHVMRLISHMSKHYNFDAIITGEMVKKSKPEPDIFLKAAEAIHVDPQECLVIEDSRNGILASNRAHMHNVFIEDKIKFNKNDYQSVEKECFDLCEVITYLNK